MARRTLVDEPEYEVLDAVPVEDVPQQKVPRRSKAARKEESRPKRPRINLFYWAVPFLALLTVLALVYAFHRVEAVLIGDSRFQIATPEYGKDSPNLKLSGLRRASKPRLMSEFDPDFGRSLYLFPIEERRKKLLDVPWVKDARISRRWPNTIIVDIVERQPVAFVQLNRPGGAPDFKLIDPDGVIMPVPQGEKLNFAILTGISDQEARESRQARVGQALEMLKEIGPLSSHISEIDVRDPGNLQALVQVDQDILTLKLGSKNYRKRLQDFLEHYPEIRAKRPDARSFDLRIDQKIFAAEVASNGQQ